MVDLEKSEKQSITKELEGDEKEQYLNQLIRCIETANKVTSAGLARACKRITNTLSLYKHDEKSGIYEKIEQDLTSGFPAITQTLNLATKKEDLTKKVERLSTKLKKIVEWNSQEKTKINFSEEFDQKSSEEQILALKKSLVQFVKEKIYAFTPETEETLNNLEEYYIDEQNFMKELKFYTKLQQTPIIGNKCHQTTNLNFIYDGEEVLNYTINLVGHFANLFTIYDIDVLVNETKKSRNCLSNENLDKAFGHKPENVFKFLRKKHAEPTSITRYVIGPYHDTNTKTDKGITEIINKTGGGAVLEVNKETMKRTDAQFFKEKILNKPINTKFFSKPKIVTKNETISYKICTPNLQMILEQTYPHDTILVLN